MDSQSSKLSTRVENWVQITEKAEWQPRDSSGSFVFRDKIWLMGGWFTSYDPCPRDVWTSLDGRHWTLVREVSPWKHGDLAMTLVFQEQMWHMGGWYNGCLRSHSASNQVWSSLDGYHWNQATLAAGWSPRMAAGTVVFQDKMWILGGTANYFFGDKTSLRNDVWCSSDGQTWLKVTEHANWSPRAFHQVVVLNEKIWVLGGGNYAPSHHALNDVWCSEDGCHWEQVVETAPWSPRIWFSSITYQDRIWVLGGWSRESGNLNDVFTSKDGKHWIELHSEIIWDARHEHSTVSFQDKIWVIGGHATRLDNQVWSLEIGKPE